MKIVDKRKAPYTVYIGRGSAFGNPFTHLPLRRTKALVQCATVEQAVDFFYRWAKGERTWDAWIPLHHRTTLLTAVRKLKKDDVLGCYCAADMPCHGRAIVKLWRELGLTSRQRRFKPTGL